MTNAIVFETAIQEIDRQMAKLQDARDTLLALNGVNDYTSAPVRRGPRVPFGTASAPVVRVPGTRKPMSEDSKQRIRDAQARRWAASRAEKAAAPAPQGGSEANTPEPPLMVAAAAMSEPGPEAVAQPATQPPQGSEGEVGPKLQHTSGSPAPHKKAPGRKKK